MSIQKVDLSNLTKGQRVNGAVLIKGYGIKQTKNNKDYVTGTLENQVQLNFKAWSESLAFTQFNKYDYIGVVAQISGVIDEYMGTYSITVDSVAALDGVDIGEFFATKYDIEAYFNALKELVKSSVSEKGYELAEKVLFENKPFADKFKLAFAAKSYHDNCKGGLLAHTYKVVNNMKFILHQYVSLVPANNQNEKDLLFLGALFHDIGKVDEMNYGEYTRIGMILGHRHIGINYLPKEDIIERYDEDWYYRLCSIIIQHHGEFEENCRTVCAYLVHKADLLDSEMTLLQDKLAKPETVNDSKQVVVNNVRLQI